MNVATGHRREVIRRTNRGHGFFDDLMCQEHVVAGMCDVEVVVAQHPKPQLHRGADRIEVDIKRLFGDAELRDADGDNPLWPPDK